MYRGPSNTEVLGFVLGLIGLLADLQAGELDVSVRDPDGNAIEDAVISATLLTGANAKAELSGGSEDQSSKAPPIVIIAQENEQFTPFVTAVEVGTAISFPNRDNILHNVYSFSQTKKFQLPLYSDEPPEPVVFDRPGVVILGCNIHDWMVAYVYVLKTPYFVKTDAEGRATLSRLPPGDYEVQARHPRKRKRGSSPTQRVNIDMRSPVQSEFTIALKPQWRPQTTQ